MVWRFLVGHARILVNKLTNMRGLCKRTVIWHTITVLTFRRVSYCPLSIFNSFNNSSLIFVGENFDSLQAAAAFQADHMIAVQQQKSVYFDVS